MSRPPPPGAGIPSVVRASFPVYISSALRGLRSPLASTLARGSVCASMLRLAVYVDDATTQMKEPKHHRPARPRVTPGKIHHGGKLVRTSGGHVVHRRPSVTRVHDDKRQVDSPRSETIHKCHHFQTGSGVGGGASARTLAPSHPHYSESLDYSCASKSRSK